MGNDRIPGETLGMDTLRPSAASRASAASRVSAERCEYQRRPVRAVHRHAPLCAATAAMGMAGIIPLDCDRLVRFGSV